MKRNVLAALFALALICALPCAAWADDAAQKESSAMALSTKSTVVSTNAKSSTNSASLRKVLSGGVFNIVPAIRTSGALDVANRSEANHARTQIQARNYAASQRWRFEHVGGGYYRIVNVWSGKVLDVVDAKAQPNARVQQYDWNNTAAQKWKFTAASGGYIISSALSDRYVLDVFNASTSNGATVQLYTRNGTRAQVWKLGKIKPVLSSGYYVLANKASSKRLSVANASIENTANVDQEAPKKNYLSQIFRLTYDKKTGYYNIRAGVSGKMLSVNGASAAAGANVRQYDATGNSAQRWAVVKNSNGTYTLRNAISGMALDVKNASTSEGANVQVFTPNGSIAQMWKVRKVTNWIPSAAFYVRSRATNTSLGIVNQNTSKNANVQMEAIADNNSQRFYMRPVGKGYYAIQNVNSGRYVDAVYDANGSNVVQTFAARRWQPVLTDNGIVFKLKSNPKVVLDILNGSRSAGANVQVCNYNGTSAQKWLLRPASLLADGTYTVASGLNTAYMLDDANASRRSGVELQIYRANNTRAQQYTFKHLGNNKYRITSVNSNKSLHSDGTTITQETTASWKAQQWLATFNPKGSFSFASVAYPYYQMAVKGGSAKNKVKVVATWTSDSKAQRWILKQQTNIIPSGTTSYDQLSVTMAQLAAIEGSTVANVNPNSGNKYRFLDLRTYTGCTAADLNKALYAVAPWVREQTWNPMYNSGQYFVDAAKKYNVNEVFLMALAGIETGWGSSANYGGSYNFYGIGTSPASYAANKGWNTKQKGIEGGAKVLADEWVYRASYPQYSPYGMRYDYLYYNRTKSYGYHHYNSSDAWMNTVADMLSKMYTNTGKSRNANFVMSRFAS